MRSVGSPQIASRREVSHSQPISRPSERKARRMLTHVALDAQGSYNHMNLTQLVEYLEQRRIEDGRLPARVRALRPFDTHHPGRAVVAVYNVNGVLLGDTLYAPDDVDWNTPRPPGVITRAQLPRKPLQQKG